MERRLAAILAADVVSYSKLMGADETGTLAALMRFRAELLEPEVAFNQGRIVKSMGDGWLITFQSAAEAVSCAFQLQDKLASDALFTLRIGVHIGDVIFQKEDIFGDVVNLAARLQEFSEPGTVALSDAAFGSLDGALAPSFDDVGMQDFKNISRPIGVWVRPVPEPTIESVQSDGRPALILRPVETSDERDEIGDLANALTGDLAKFFASVGWLRTETRTEPNTQDEAYIVLPTLRARGNRLRLELSLSFPNGQAVWTTKYDGVLEDSFDWQDETAEIAAMETLDHILDRERQRLNAISLADMTAEECVISVVMNMVITNEQSMSHNMNLLAAALEKNPRYADGYGYALFNYISSATLHLETAYRPHEKKFPFWVQAARQLDNPTPMLTIALGLVAFREEGDSAALRRAIRDALRRAPFLGEVVNFCGFGHLWMGDPSSALACFRSLEKSIGFNPYAVPILGGASIACVQIGDDDAAIEYALKGLQATNDYMALHSTLVAAYGHKGNKEAAARHLKRLSELAPHYTIKSRREASAYGNTPGNLRFEEGLRLGGLPE